MPYRDSRRERRHDRFVKIAYPCAILYCVEDEVIARKDLGKGGKSGAKRTTRKERGRLVKMETSLEQ